MANEHDKDEKSLIPYHNPVEVFSQLPVFTRAFLQGLDQEDILTLIDLIKAYQRASVVGWFFKWTVAIIVGAFVTTSTLGNSFKEIYRWFFNGH